MTGKVTDEMLMAYVDGEIDETTGAMIEQVLATDTDLAARAHMFRASRTMMCEAFGDARREPVPEALVKAALQGSSGSTVVPLPRRRILRYAVPLAACLALVFAGAGYLAGRAGTGPHDPLGHMALVTALSGTKAGETRPIFMADQEASFATRATYRIEGGFCRTFDVSGAAASLSGVGCNRGAGWSIDLTVAQSADNGLYTPASGAALHSIDAYLDALEASAPLSTEEENELLQPR